MALDYKLHKATEKKIEELVDQKVDIKRREQNLIDKIERLQRDNKRLMEDQAEWEKRQSLEFRQLQKSEKKARDAQEDVQITLDEVSEKLETLKTEKKALQKENRKVKREARLNRSILRRVKKEKGVVDSQLEVLESRKEQIAGLDKKAQKNLVEAERLYSDAQDKEREADRILNRAKEKDREANSLKISLGIRAKVLDEKEKGLNKMEREVKYARQSLELAGKEIALKRKLLTKAYSQKDVKDLDIKVEQMLASKKN